MARVVKGEGSGELETGSDSTILTSLEYTNYNEIIMGLTTMRGDKCYPGNGKRVKIPLLPENVGKGVLTTSEPSETLERVMTPTIQIPNMFSIPAPTVKYKLNPICPMFF